MSIAVALIDPLPMLSRQIGIIGYLTPDTKDLVAAMTVDFTPEIAAINAEAEKLTAQELILSLLWAIVESLRIRILR